jgi:tRNA modification GTPase
MIKQMEKETDTITARATPSGEGAIAIIRVSGPDTFEIIQRCFHPYKDKCVKFNYLTLGKFIDPLDDSFLDEVFVVYFQKPLSYTGEDAGEIYCHGSPAISTRIVETLCHLGARFAEPGEFTKRAFINGKIDLTKAEAVCDLIRAQTDKSAALALRQLQGDLYHKIKSVKDNIVTVGVELEARLDFPEENLGAQNNEAILGILGETGKEIENLIRQGINARIYTRGARVTVLGRPNTGKSSLFNALLRMERAIVTPHPGTTRDSIEGTVDLKGCPVTYIDTAGIHHTENQVEMLGMERTKKEIYRADLNLFLIDGSLPLSDEDSHIFQIVSQSPFILVLNKMDLAQCVLKDETTIFEKKAHKILHTSALKGDGIESLETAITDFLISETGIEDALVTNERHLTQLARSKDSLINALDAIRGGIAEELVMVDIRESLHHLSLITGEEIDEEILDAIFRRFCIGK